MLAPFATRLRPLCKAQLGRQLFAPRSPAASRSIRSATMANALRDHGVIPTILPDFTPSTSLKVRFKDGKEVEFGNVLTPTEVFEKPQVSWTSEPGKLYTLVMTDPDAPSRADPKFGEWNHWLVLNIPGNRVEEGEERKGYVGSGPPPGTGLHRYIYVLYKHDQPIAAPNEPHLKSTQSKHRNNWSVRKFAEENGLGAPVAANLYQAEWDDIVPKLYATFKD